MTDENTTPEIDIQKLKSDMDEMTGIAKRALADLQNFKKKADEERSQLLTLGKLSVVTELLPVLDNFKRAFQHVPEDLKTNEWVTGVTNIEQQFISIVKNAGLEEVPTTGNADPNLHETVSSIPGPQDQIIEVLENGYTLNGKLVRPAKVVVGNGQ